MFKYGISGTTVSMTPVPVSTTRVSVSTPERVSVPITLPEDMNLSSSNSERTAAPVTGRPSPASTLTSMFAAKPGTVSPAPLLPPQPDPSLPSHIANALSNLVVNLRNKAASDPTKICATSEFTSGFHPMGLARACAGRQVSHPGSPWRQGLILSLRSHKSGGYENQAAALARALPAALVSETDLSPVDIAHHVNESFVVVFGHLPSPGSPPTPGLRLPSRGLPTTGRAAPSMVATVEPRLALPGRQTPLPPSHVSRASTAISLLTRGTRTTGSTGDRTSTPVVPMPGPYPVLPPDTGGPVTLPGDASVPPPGLPTVVPGVISKQYAGYTYAAADPTLVAFLKSTLPAMSVSSGIGSGWSTGGIELPSGDTVMLFDAVGAASAQAWYNGKVAAGYAILLGNLEGPGWSSPQADLDRLLAEMPAEAGNVASLLATKSIKLAADLTALPGEYANDPLWTVVDDSNVDWKKPDEVDSSGKEKPNYLLYAATGLAAVLGIAYIATRS